MIFAVREAILCIAAGVGAGIKSNVGYIEWARGRKRSERMVWLAAGMV